MKGYEWGRIFSEIDRERKCFGSREHEIGEDARRTFFWGRGYKQYRIRGNLGFWRVSRLLNSVGLGFAIDGGAMLHIVAELCLGGEGVFFFGLCALVLRVFFVARDNVAPRNTLQKNAQVYLTSRRGREQAKSKDAKNIEEGRQ